MTTLASFNGIDINMYFGDHPPPHFHAFVDSKSYSFGIVTVKPLAKDANRVPDGLERKLRKWVLVGNRQEQLMQAWHACSTGKRPRRIA